jgi:hypothetical protein
VRPPGQPGREIAGRQWLGDGEALQDVAAEQIQLRPGLVVFDALGDDFEAEAVPELLAADT